MSSTDQPRPLEYLSTEILMHELQARFQHAVFIGCPFDAGKGDKSFIESYTSGDDNVCAFMSTSFIQQILAEQESEEMDEDED